MRVRPLFLVSLANWKWTGPAEHAVNLAAGLASLGEETRFLCAQAPKGETHRLTPHLQKNAIESLDAGQLLPKHFNPITHLLDTRRVYKALEPWDQVIAFTTLDNDHRVLASVKKKREKAGKKTTLIRWVFDPELVLWSRWLRRTDGLVFVSRNTLEQEREKGFLPPECYCHAQAPVDLERFYPRERSSLKAVDTLLGLKEEDIVLGLVARVQRRRKFEVLLEAFRRALEKEPRLKLVVLGRGTHKKELLDLPAKKFGIEERIVAPGYISADYPEVVARFDAKLYLVSGTDASARAVREAFASARPVIAVRQGMLPELIGDNERGMLTDLTPEALSAAMLNLAAHRDAWQARGKAARLFAEANFNKSVVTRQLRDFALTLMRKE